MAREPIYLDLDNLLIGPIKDKDDELVDLEIRPDASWFLEALSRYGDLFLLTSANRTWAEYALERLGDDAKRFKNVFTREDLYPIALILEMIDREELNKRDKEELYAQVSPILPPGVIFDDYPAGSWMYYFKGLANGIANSNPEMWIEVEPFVAGERDRGGLRRAFAEFLKRNTRWTQKPSISGRRRVG